jgi:Domain of unknown function (DUF4157)
VNERTQIQAKTETQASSLPAGANLLQHKCACGATPGVDGECAECRNTRLQSSALNYAKPETEAPTVREALSSPGQPLDEGTRVFMESRFGHNFAQVRVHADAQAAESARAVNALAYTVGQDIVFAAQRYAPRTGEGQRLLAHELAHVVQQRAGAVDGVPAADGIRVSDPADRFEQEAAATAERATISGAGQRQEGDEREESPPTVQRVYRTSTVQRQATPPVATPPVATTGRMSEPGERAQAMQTDPVGALLSVDALESIRETATQTTFLAGAYAALGIRTVDTLKSSLTVASQTYGNAYANYARSVREARAEALNQKDNWNTFLGIGIGVGVGLISGAIVPAGLAFGWKVLVEAAGEAAEAVIAEGVQATGVTDVQGTDLEPGGLSPDARNSEMWERLSGLYRAVLGIQRHTQYLPLVLGNAEYALGQFRLIEAGGQADMSQAELVDMAVSLNRAAAHLTQLNAELSEKLNGLNQLQAQAAAAPRSSEQEMECDIWILWMSTLTDDQSNDLDLDAIEDRLHEIGVLGPNSLLGVDFGRYTSEDDELAALAAARRKAVDIRARQQELTGG